MKNKKGGLGFGGFGKGNPMKMLSDLPKIQKTIQKSLEEFKETSLKKEFQGGLIEIVTKGETIKETNFSDELITMLHEDKEMAQDIIVASISAMNVFVNEERMKKIESDAKASGLNPQLVNQVFSNELINNLM